MVVAVVARGASLHAAYKWRQHSGHDNMGDSVILQSQADCAGESVQITQTIRPSHSDEEQEED